MGREMTTARIDAYQAARIEAATIALKAEYPHLRYDQCQFQAALTIYAADAIPMPDGYIKRIIEDIRIDGAERGHCCLSYKHNQDLLISALRGCSVASTLPVEQSVGAVPPCEGGNSGQSKIALVEEKIYAALHAALQQCAKGCGERYVMVPVEPTEEMINAGTEFQGAKVYSNAEVRHIYADMIAAHRTQKGE